MGAKPKTILSGVTFFFFMAAWIGLASVAGASGGTTEPSTFRSEGMRVNSVVLNGPWEFAIGQGHDNEDNPDNAGLKWAPETGPSA